MKRNIFITILAAIIISTALIGILFAKQPEEEPSVKPLTKEDIFDELELFADAITIINANYVKETDPKDIIYGALDGMFTSLDSHSDFLTPDEFKELKEETIGEFGGVGIKVTRRDGVITVISPLEGTPAYNAGILPEDKIVKIDNQSTEDMTLDDVVKMLRGMPGTVVKLTIIREGEEKLKEFSLTRAIIKIKSIREALILENRLGYIKIVDFQQNTSADLDRALKRLSKQGMDSLIVDLRNNPGGLLTSAAVVSEKFLKKGTPIVSTKGRIKGQDMVFKSKAFKPYTNIAIVILVNKGSASASEIVAGALKDNKRAAIVGETTFGKGSVQTAIPMRDGSAVRLTTSYYYTPSGDIINDKGIIPDVKVELAKKKKDETKDKEEKEKEERPFMTRWKEDNQLIAAVELLKDKKRYASFISKK
jgi:carboxyl-terminal processing protease